MLLYSKEVPTIATFCIILAIGLPVPLPVPGGPQEPWGPSRVVREMTLRAPRHPRPIGLGSRGPWVLLARDMGALAALWGGEGKGPNPQAPGGLPGALRVPGSIFLTLPPRDL